MQKLRGLTQVLFLIIFFALLITGKAQFWLAFVLFSIVLAAFFGRYYCSWACPINTLMRPTTWIAKKFGLASKAVSGLLKSEKPRYLLLSLFLVGLVYTIYSITQGKKFPLPLIVIPIGLISTVYFSPVAWHRYLCPWGTLFSLTGRFSRFKFKNNVSSCSDCGKCSRICPSHTIKVDKGVYEFNNTNCLMCFQCKDTCPKHSISLIKIAEQGGNTTTHSA